VLPEKALDNVEDHVKLALRARPDINQARLQYQRDELEVVRTRDGVLPKLDGFVAFGKSGYGGSFTGTVKDLPDDAFDMTLGVKGHWPWEHRAEHALERRALLTREQASEAVENLLEQAQLDVRTGYIEVERLREQVVATAATRTLREETLRGETEKFRVGRSTNLLVSQAQRDLLAAQVAEVQAAVNVLKAVVELYRRDGSLLTRLGIDAPGATPVEASL
jgi:outer membrane protein TolC